MSSLNLQVMGKYNLVSIFDFSVSKKELNDLFIFHYTKEEYLENTSTYTAFVDLAFLFKLRNNPERFRLFLKISKEIEENEMEYRLA